MTKSEPTADQTTIVQVIMAPDATVTANYRTTDASNSSIASATGEADIPFVITEDDPGEVVAVDVTAALVGQTAACSTSFAIG